MANFTKFLCLSLLLSCLQLGLWAEKDLHFTGDYFIYSDDLDFLYGGGNIVLSKDSYTISGDVVYIDMKNFQGVIYGNVLISRGTEKEGGDAFFFQGFPFSFRFECYGEHIVNQGNLEIKDKIEKISPQRLQKSDLYWEFSECKINKNKKIKAKKVFPYIMGMPSIPFESFSIARGKIPEKTRFYFKNIGLSSLDGLSLTFLYRLREPFVTGDTLIKLYERELFNGDSDIKRGILVDGNMDWLIRKKSFLSVSGLFQTADESFNVTLVHKKDLKDFSYSFSQNISGRENIPAVFEFNSWVMLKKFQFISPKISFSHNLENSYSYEISTPLKVLNKLNLNFGYLRKVIQDEVESDTGDFSSSLDFTSSLLNLSSTYNLSQNILEATRTHNFTTNLRFKTLYFLDKNVSIQITPFYMFSTIPAAETEPSHITPGITTEIKSSGLILPFDFMILPTLTVNHLWDNLDVDQTEFNYFISLKKIFGKLGCSLDYSLVSRYRSEGFWVEGYNVKSMNFNLEFKDESRYSLGLRLYYNNDLSLENMTFTGEIFFLGNIKLSSFLLYYWQEERFQSVEVFIEKKFSNIFKLQCGYSLALKKFFVKFFTL